MMKAANQSRVQPRPMKRKLEPRKPRWRRKRRRQRYDEQILYDLTWNAYLPIENSYQESRQ